MPQRKQYLKFSRDFTRKNLALLPILLILFLILFLNWGKLLGNIAIICFVATILANSIWDYFYLRKFRCPDCGQSISQPTIKHRQPRQPINFYCSRCDVEWETGLKERSFYY